MKNKCESSSADDYRLGKKLESAPKLKRKYLEKKFFLYTDLNREGGKEGQTEG